MSFLFGGALIVGGVIVTFGAVTGRLPSMIAALLGQGQPLSPSQVGSAPPLGLGGGQGSSKPNPKVPGFAHVIA